MEERWKLDDIYSSSDGEDFKNDLMLYESKIKELSQWAQRLEIKGEGLSLSDVEHYIREKNAIIDLERLAIYVNLSLSADTSNEALLKLADRLEEIGAGCAGFDAVFKKLIIDVDLNEMRRKSPLIDEHFFILNEIKSSARYCLSKDKEEMLAVMKATGSVMWRKLWEQLTSTLKADMEIDGVKKQLPLSVVRNYAYSEDKEMRKNAYFAEMEAYKKIERPAAFALNGIKGEVISVSKMRGYSSVLEMTAIESRMDIELLDVMMNVVKESLPIFEKYFRKKAEILGYENSIPFYEIFAPVGNADLKYSYEQAKEFIVKNFSDFSVGLGEFAENAFENRWIDVYPRDGKVGGAFCEAIHSIRQSRILTNFSQSFNDIVTIAHELGHAYHDGRLYDVSAMNAFYPMPIAETASTMCETIVTRAALKSAGRRQSIAILENDVASSAQTIVDIYSRFIFEDRLIEERKKGSLSVNELKDIMLWAQRKAYGNVLNEKFMHPYMWLCKPHYYDAEFNYYNFPYAFGLLLSKGLYAMYLERGEEFVKSYDRFLEISSTTFAANGAKSIGIDLYDCDFWRRGIKLTEQDIDLFCSLCDGMD